MTLKGHSHFVWALTVFPDGRLVSGSQDNTLKLWQVSPTPAAILAKHFNWGSDLAFFSANKEVQNRATYTRISAQPLPANLPQDRTPGFIQVDAIILSGRYL